MKIVNYPTTPTGADAIVHPETSLNQVGYPRIQNFPYFSNVLKVWLLHSRELGFGIGAAGTCDPVFEISYARADHNADVLPTEKATAIMRALQTRYPEIVPGCEMEVRDTFVAKALSPLIPDSPLTKHSWSWYSNPLTLLPEILARGLATYILRAAISLYGRIKPDQAALLRLRLDRNCLYPARILMRKLINTCIWLETERHVDHERLMWWVDRLDPTGIIRREVEGRFGRNVCVLTVTR